VNAYIIDTGIRFTHNEFGGRAGSGFDAVDGGAADDCNGHGTHVSGTVGGSTYGVAKNVHLVAVRVLDCGGSGTTAGVIAGIDWVTANHVSPAVANMSLGGGASTTLDNAVVAAIASGVSFAVAAGNGNFLGIGVNACNSSPARVPAALTVGATNKNDKRASFSNFGSCVDLFAPGVDITSSWYSSNTATNTISGTSMSSPHVAGVAALYLQGNPGASPATVSAALIANATTGVVTSPGAGSPNRLLFTNY
jgi:subtilisin family serine protease